jgi:hypothetical protein
MSERMSNADIEDVLSSIRRLVSDDLRPGHAPAVPLSAAEVRPVVPRLVLTPALRVPPEPAPAPPPADGGSLAERLAELEVLMAGQAPQFEDELAPPSTALPEVRPFERLAADGAPAAILPDDPPQEDAHTVPEAPYVDVAAEPDRMEDAAPVAPGLPAEPDAEDALLQDEDVLRALIRDVLREELQGVMGERVTRNLRKLIRAEIARALTARGIA